MSPKPRVLIGSPVCQKPEILRMFFHSLDHLDSQAADVSYAFVDDNTDALSSQMLRSFAGRFPDRSVIFPGNTERPPYIRDENTHYWNEDLIWKVADYKNRLIDYAKRQHFDALFLVDSDLLLQPDTLAILLNSDKEIVSEIFWTSWQPQSLPAPQVWLSDQYTQYEHAPNEQLSSQEQLIRQMAFYSKLRVPGLYEVGGLGACTLIRRSALEAGVHFGKIKNVSFWGEDRHFCIRAVALGFSLFVDTHRPAFHVYRESDYAEAANWMKQVYGSSPAQTGVPGTPVRRSSACTRPKITLSMIVRNEADKHLSHILSKHREYIDEAVIIDDGSTDHTVEICHELLKGIPLHIVHNETSRFMNEVSLRKQQWQETIRQSPEWILNMDADEVFEDGFAQGVHELLSQEKGEVCCFRLYDMWSETHYREDSYWHAHDVYRPFLLRYHPGHRYIWKEQPLHCGRFPHNIFELPSFLSHYRVKHLGWSTHEIRQEKYERYKRLDPSGLYGWKEQYESILDPQPRLIAWSD
ncbi:glycosyltransferase [Brevibacillus sp. GCM10020057]|uniref:glycosyltransferase n=1 Tax=Brevibacillus sp. GCM10020057 TaxID=3317327 RepID=UPI0036357547